ncbi:MAG: hypothetical protein KAY32_17975, partial [Candidatus Eisenbacteria sp.]|nr:hypothetical protein [Candidatus Eisenbacteria bacterium]
AEAAARGLAASAALIGLPSLFLSLSVGAAPLAEEPLFSGGAGGLVEGLRTSRAGFAVAAFALGALVRNALAAWRGGWETPADQREVAEASDSDGRRLAPARWRLLMLTGRLLFLQAGFSGRFLQRSGFLFLLPALAGPRDPEGCTLAERLREDLAGGRAPNTHPLMAAALAGGLLRLASEARQGIPARPAGRLLDVGGAVLAQWGDRALWGGARPLLALLALLALAAGPWFGLGLLLVGGLALELGGRWALLHWGARRGWALVQGFCPLLWTRLPRALARAQLPAAGILAAGLAGTRLGGSGDPLAWVAGGAWFILGLLAGRVALCRPMAWGAGCWVVSLTGAAWSGPWAGG